MDTQLSRFYLAAHPLHHLMVQFRANGSHQPHPADPFASLTRGWALRANETLLSNIVPTRPRSGRLMRDGRRLKSHLKGFQPSVCVGRRFVRAGGQSAKGS